MLDAVCTYVTSSAASRDSAVKLTTDSYQFWVAHLNLLVFIWFARKVQEYGDAFSKSFSIFQNTLSFTCILCKHHYVLVNWWALWFQYKQHMTTNVIYMIVDLTLKSYDIISHATRKLNFGCTF